ncbi:F-box domain-containing protein [Xylariales sp. AK1849]|nr:F-box domain-containing protein [Xylariales sp. AK1849]
MTTSASINDLPPELLSQIFGYLAGPAPSEVLLHEEPSCMLRATYGSREANTGSGNTPIKVTKDLKSVSRVSSQWRTVVIPLLFCNVLWRPQISTLSIFNLQPVPLLQFILKHQLEHYVTTFTLLVDFAEDKVDPTQIPYQIRPADLEWLWDQLFSVIDPLRFTIIAPPTTLAALLNRMLFLDDAWSFNIPYHILSLARSSRGGTASTTGSSSVTAVASCKNTEAPSSPLFTLRRWTSILLNEGSSIRAYQTYEFFLRSPPSVLSALLGIGEYPNNQPLLTPFIVDFNYIAIFPLSSHVNSLFTHLPKIDRLFVQLTPRPENQILKQPQSMRGVDMADLWMERNSTYSQLFAELTQPTPQDSWATLKVFESGDAADKESWDLAMAFLKRSRVENWVAEREGVLVKVDDTGKAEEPRDLVGSLRRIAFNGVAPLPYSSMWMYTNTDGAHET